MSELRHMNDEVLETQKRWRQTLTRIWNFLRSTKAAILFQLREVTKQA